MIKKALIFLTLLIFLAPLLIAEDYNLEISTSKTIFAAGENIMVKVTLLDSANNPTNDNVLIILEDAERNIKVEKQIITNEFVEIEIPAGASHGQGKITAKYQDLEVTGSFTIEISELSKFEIIEDKLIITNIGNTRYTKTIQITIGETTGIKEPKLDAGESISYRLIAPEGIYTIFVSDGNPETAITQGGVRLTGTGNVVGAIDETPAGRSGITGGIRPGEEDETNILSYMKHNGKFIYTFILVIFGAMILLAIERRYRRKV